MKSSSGKVVRLHLKRGKQVLMVLIDTNATVDSLKHEIQEMINATGGLKPLDDDDDDFDNVKADIEIPTTSFDQENDSDSDVVIQANGSKTIDESDDDAIGINGLVNQIDSISSIKLGKPVDKSQASGTNFTEIQGTKNMSINELQVDDGDILAFAMVEEDFLVIDPVEDAD